MANLSAFLNFSIVLDNSITPAKVRFVDNSSYPNGLPINGLVEITQPDGVLATGAMFGTSGALSPILIEMRLDTRSQIQAGQWRVKYTVNSAGYDATILDRTFQLNYSEPAAYISPLLNLFLPQLRAQDGTIYTIEGLTLQNVTRSWQAVIEGVATVTAGNVLQFDMSSSGNYYDAMYNVSMSNIVNWTVNSNAWVTVRELITAQANYQIVPPPSLLSLLNDLNEFKATLDAEGCGCSDNDRANYSYAESLFSHILKRGCYGQTLGLDAYITELVKVLNGGVLPTHDNTEAVLAAYDWTSPCSGSGTTETMSNLGNGEGQVYASKLGANFRMRSLKQGAGITITQNGDEILITSANTGEANTGENVGTNGQGLYIGKNGTALQIRKIDSGAGISLSVGGGGELIITNSATGETNSGANVGTGAQVFKDKSGVNLRMRSLVQGSGITITQNADEIVFSATGGGGSGEVNAGENVGTGVGFYKGKSGLNLQFYKLLGSTSTGIKVTKLPGLSDDIEISGPGFTNIGSGDAEVYKNFDVGTNTHRLRKLKSGTNVGISIVGDDIVISSSGGGGGVDVTAPFIVYAFLISPTVVRVIFSEPVQITNANGCSVSSPTSNPIVSVSGTGSNTLDFTVTNAIQYGAVVQFGFNASLGNIRDLAASPNPMATLGSAYTVVNGIPVPNLDAIPGVVITSPIDDHVLKYSGGVIINGPAPGGGGGGGGSSEEGTL
jgi:hypothetical protein